MIPAPMSRRHERARRDAEAYEPGARVIRHRGYVCYVVDDEPTWRECIARLDANTARITDDERTEVERVAEARYD